MREAISDKMLNMGREPKKKSKKIVEEKWQFRV